MYSFIFVDDEDLIRRFFTQAMDFEAYGFFLAAALSSGEKALKYLEDNPSVDVMITDIKMGGMSGLELCNEVRERNRNIELVLLTGYKDFEFARQAIRQNAFDYLLKPTSYADLERLFVRLRARLDEKKALKDPDGGDEIYCSSLVEMMKSTAEGSRPGKDSLENVARQLSMNAAYLSRVFKLQTGMNWSDYLVQTRVRKAKSMLRDPTVKVYEISDKVGYKSIQHFYRVFKRVTGVTPSEFRAEFSKSGKEE